MPGPRSLVLAAVGVYCVWAALLSVPGPGLQYDEALLVLGAVHMRHSSAVLSLPHDADTWLCWSGRCFPLMTVRYVGAVKDYLCLPLFAAFGPSAELVRFVSMLLGAAGIWGIGYLLAGQVGRPAAAVAFVLAISPAYVNLTVLDNGTVAVWMGALGVLCLAVGRYLQRRTAAAAFWVGLAAGAGVWARANFLWLLAAITLAALTLRKRALLPVSQVAALAAGGVFGASPFIVYQVQSGGGTWRAMGTLLSPEAPGRALWHRLTMFSETLLLDGEHRAVWNGPPLPEWQFWLFPVLVLVAAAVCLSQRRSLWARLITLTFLILAGFLFLSRLPVAQHHLIVLAPLAAAVTVLASALALERFRAARLPVWLAAAVYVSCALYWQMAAIRGIWKTGGTGQWSDAIFTVADYLEQKHPGREIKILDWGFQNNLYVISDGRIRSREINAGSTGAVSDRGLTWVEEIREGGVFLTTGPEHRAIPAATEAFLRALIEAKPAMTRFIVKERSRAVYAEIFEIVPAAR